MITAGNEGKTFQQSFLIINMQRKQGLFLVIKMLQNIYRDSYYMANLAMWLTTFLFIVPPLC